MKLGLIIEGEYDEPVISKLVRRICKQSGCPVNISKERIRFGRGFGNISKKLDAFAEQLQIVGSEAIVVVADNDRKSRNLRLNSLRDKIRGISVPVAVGIAIEAVEAWLLADEQALNLSLGTTQIPKLPSPSKIKNPKDKLEQVAKKYANQPVLRDLYGQIADRADKKVLDKRCRCFNRFHNELRSCLRKAQPGT